MTLLLTESFDWLDSADVEAGGYGSIINYHNPYDPTLTIESGRTSNCLKVSPAVGSNGHYWTYFQGISLTNPTQVAGREYTIGFAVKFDTFPIVGYLQAFCLIENLLANFEIGLLRGSSGALLLGLPYSSTNYVSWATGPILANGIWYYIELKFNLHATTGNAVINVNGVEEISYTNQDIYYQDDTFAALILGMNNGYNYADIGDIYFDDIYICDDQGSYNNDFLGDVQIQALEPSGNGNSSQFTGSDADSTDNYLHIDEATPDDDTSYVEDGTTDNKDTYAYDNTSELDSVHAVNIKTIAKKSGIADLKSVARHSTSETDSAALGLDTDYSIKHDIHEINPSTSSPWTSSEVDAAEFGVKVA